MVILLRNDGDAGIRDRVLSDLARPDLDAAVSLHLNSKEQPDEV